MNQFLINLLPKMDNLKILLKDTSLSNKVLNLVMDLTNKQLEQVTIEDLCLYSEEELKASRYVGAKTIHEIKKTLGFYGISLKPNLEDSIQINDKRAILFILKKIYDLEKFSFDKNVRNFREYLKNNQLLQLNN